MPFTEVYQNDKIPGCYGKVEHQSVGLGRFPINGKGSMIVFFRIIVGFSFFLVIFAYEFYKYERTVKILHTSDWHLGHTLYNYDRTEEQQAMLKQMVQIVKEQQPDVFLLCGDVYHTPTPSSAVQTMLTEALLAIHKARPEMVIVMTAGNHDSGSKHEIFQSPWRELNVYAIGQLEKERPQEHIIEVKDKGFVMAVPYCSERNMPTGFFQQLTDLVSERNTAGLPVVMTAHTTVRGSDYTGHDHTTEYMVGGIDEIALEQLGEGYDYLALGHIHHAQFVHSGHHNARYCGTPLPVSFDECYAHSVSMVEIGRHGERPTVKEIAIDNPHPLVTLPADGFTTWEAAKELLTQFPADLAAYIRLNVEVDDFLPQEAQAEAALLTDGKQCRFCCINARRKAVSRAEARMLSVQEFQAEAPIDIARRYANDVGIDFDSEMQVLFQEVMKEVEGGEV